MICADIAARSFFNAPIYGVTEIVGASIVCSVFLQLANAIHARRITRADAFSNGCSANGPARRRSSICFSILPAPPSSG